MPLNSITREHLANLRALNAGENGHEGFGQYVTKAWQWREKERRIIHKAAEEIGRGHVRQDESISAHEADRQIMQRIKFW